MVEFIRGETELLRFKRIDSNGGVITETPDELYFSFKRNYDNDDYIFQKSLADFIQNGNYWLLSIPPEDTISLPVGVYYFDIKVVTPFYSRYVVEPQQCKLRPNVTEEY